MPAQSGLFIFRSIRMSGQNPYNAQASVLTTSGGQAQVYDITAATIIKAAPGRVFRVNVQVAGSTTGTVNDCLTTGAAAITNQIAVIPETVGPLLLEWPCATGIVVVPGTGQTLSVSYL
jgi:hypothetical protein